MDTALETWLLNESELIKKYPEHARAVLWNIARCPNIVSILEAMRNGARIIDHWYVCRAYRLTSVIPDYIDKYLSDLRRGVRWDYPDGIDTMLIDSRPPGRERAGVEWLVSLVQYGWNPFDSRAGRDCPDEDSYKYCVHGYQLGLFAEAFVWSGGLLDMAIDDRHVTADLATAIINVAARRNLTYFLQMYREYGGRLTHACNIAAKHGNAAYLEHAYEMGGDIRYACNFAAIGGHTDCLQSAYEMGGDIRHACKYAANSGHANCLYLAAELGGNTDHICEIAAAAGHADCLRTACGIGSDIGQACERAAEGGHTECLQLAFNLGGELGNSLEIAIANGHLECARAVQELADQEEFLEEQ